MLSQVSLDQEHKLIRDIFNARGIVFEEEGAKKFTLRLRDVIYQHAKIRSAVADLFIAAIEDRETYVPSHDAIIGVSWAIAPVVGILGDRLNCPIVAIAPEPIHHKDHQEILVFGQPILGKPTTNFNYIVVDDFLKTGRTIAQTIEIWARLGYRVERVIVFCDNEEGGKKYIEDRIAKFAEEHNIPIAPKISAITTRTTIRNTIVSEKLPIRTPPA